MREAVYSRPDPALIGVGAEAIELSPLIPGSQVLEEQADGAFERMTVLAPPGVLERRYVLAHALRLLSPGGRLIALAPKDRGGARLARELAAFGCTTEDSARRHHRFCSTVRPQKPEALEAAIAAGGPQIAPALGLWTQPGVFSWDRPDPGSRLLIDQLPQLSGVGADLGCGIGLLAGAALQSPTVQRLTLTDIDRRAIEAARRNIQDMRASFVWGDARAEANGLRDLDFVVMNPPFHEQGWEDRGLGASFIRSAAAGLKPKGVCWMVANRHLPYEAVIAPLFPRARQVAQVEGYKVYEARR